MLVDLNELHRLNVDFIDPVQLNASECSRVTLERQTSSPNALGTLSTTYPSFFRRVEIAAAPELPQKRCHTATDRSSRVAHSSTKFSRSNLSVPFHSRALSTTDLAIRVFGVLRERLNRTDDSRKGGGLGRSDEERSLPLLFHETGARTRLRPRGGRSEPRHDSKESLANSASLCMSLRARVSA